MTEKPEAIGRKEVNTGLVTLKGKPILMLELDWDQTDKLVDDMVTLFSGEKMPGELEIFMALKKKVNEYLPRCLNCDDNEFRKLGWSQIRRLIEIFKELNRPFFATLEDLGLTRFVPKLRKKGEGEDEESPEDPRQLSPRTDTGLRSDEGAVSLVDESPKK